MSTPDATPSDRADELLALRCQLGERPAFDALVQRWAGPLHRHVLRVTGEPDTADELTQDIWLRVVQGIARLQDAAQFRAWLFGIAHRVLMDRYRRLYADRHDAGVELDAVEDPAPRASPEHHAAAHDIERHLHRLPLVEREVLTLFYLDELPLADVARVLGIPSGTVKSRLFRARQQLKATLTEKDRP